MSHRTSHPRAASTPDALAKILVQMKRWPDSWKTDETDVALGEGLVRIFEDFLTEQYLQGLSTRTINRHRGNLWILGGELVRRRGSDSELWDCSPMRILNEFVCEDGGPILVTAATEREQEDFDVTCRKLFEYLPDDPGGRHAIDAEA